MHGVRRKGWQGVICPAKAAQLVVRLLIDFLDDALSLSVAGPARRTEAADRPALEKLVARLAPEKLISLIERCLESDQQIDRRVQLVLIVEVLFDALGQSLGRGLHSPGLWPGSLPARGRGYVSRKRYDCAYPFALSGTDGSLATLTQTWTCGSPRKYQTNDGPSSRQLSHAPSCRCRLPCRTPACSWSRPPCFLRHAITSSRSSLRNGSSSNLNIFCSSFFCSFANSFDRDAGECRPSRP